MKKGFFLSETVVVLAIVAVVLLGVFQVYSGVYSKYKSSEKYNTPLSIGALAAVEGYYDSKTSVDLKTLVSSVNYVDLTNDSRFDSDYYERLKNVYKIDAVYLINFDKLTDDEVATFDVLTRKFIKTIRKKGGIVLILNLNGNEFTSVDLSTQNVKGIELVGDASDEYAVYISLNGTYTEPGYTGTDITPTITCESGVTGCSVVDNKPALDTTIENTYYLYYNFDGYITRRKVVVQDN